MENSQALSSHGPQIELSPTPAPLTVQYTTRTVMVHTVTGMELDTIASLSNSVHLTFFGICLGALVAFGIVLSTSQITEPLTYSAYVSLLAVSLIGTSYFGLRGVIDYREARRKVNDLKLGKQ